MSELANERERRKSECYAFPLGGCNRPTKEHYVSKGVLCRLSESGRIYVRGFPWQDERDEFKEISIQTLSARMLCDNHHKALNDLKLDETACELLDALKATVQSVQECSPLSAVHHYDGQRIERWLLKVLCGVFASGNAPIPELESDICIPPIPSQSVPLPLLRVLFGLDKFKQGCGLYLSGSTHRQVKMDPKDLKFTYLTHGKELVGSIISLLGLEFMLVINAPLLRMIPGVCSQDWLYCIGTTRLRFDKAKTNTHVEFVLDW